MRDWISLNTKLGAIGPIAVGAGAAQDNHGNKWSGFHLHCGNGNVKLTFLSWADLTDTISGEAETHLHGQLAGRVLLADGDVSPMEDFCRHLNQRIC